MPTALYKYTGTTFVLVECNALFEKRQKKSQEDMCGLSLLELFELPIALLLAEVLHEVYFTGVEKDIRHRQKQHYYVRRVSNGNVAISYKIV